MLYAGVNTLSVGRRQKHEDMGVGWLFLAAFHSEKL
jgi:hypothetical protein